MKVYVLRYEGGEYNETAMQVAGVYSSEAGAEAAQEAHMRDYYCEIEPYELDGDPVINDPKHDD